MMSLTAPYVGQSYTVLNKNHATMKMYIGEPPEIQIGSDGGHSRSAASLGLITQFILIE